jgi:hypothetical protein
MKLALRTSLLISTLWPVVVLAYSVLDPSLSSGGSRSTVAQADCASSMRSSDAAIYAAGTRSGRPMGPGHDLRGASDTVAVWGS